MTITSFDFSDFIVLSLAGTSTLSGLTAFFWRKWRVEKEEKEKQTKILEIEATRLSEKLQESEISRNLSHVADTVRQVNESQTLLKSALEQFKLQMEERVRYLEIEHAKGCAMLIRQHKSGALTHD